MRARVAACTALLLLYSACAGAGENSVPLARIATTIEQPTSGPSEPAVNSTGEKYGRQQQHALSATPVEKVKPPHISVDAATSGEAEPFGLGSEPASTGDVPAKWQELEAQLRADNQILDHCRDDLSSCPPAARRFLAIIDDGRARSGRARVGVINREIDLAIVPTSDIVQWGVADRWSPPLETFSTGRGDCEDYAIAKYVALRAAGVPKRDVKLVIVRNTDVDENHAIVAVRLDGAWVILDNRWLALVRDRDMQRATPLFELDDNGVRRFNGPAPTADVVQANAD
jgi:predicted transglutaminase-like cysteine proteinase